MIKKFYIGEDTNGGGDGLLRIGDTRKVDAASNLPITDKNRRDVSIDPEMAKKIIKEARAQGVDPYTALAMAHQESGFAEDDNPFHLYGGAKTDDPIKEGISFLKDKLNYAKKLGKKTEPEQLQAYNGYGKLTKVSEDHSSKYYGIDVSKQPLDMNKNPVYGKRIVDIRDNVLKNNPDIVKLVQGTEMPAPQNYKPLSVQQRSDWNNFLDYVNKQAGI